MITPDKVTKAHVVQKDNGYYIVADDGQWQSKKFTNSQFYVKSVEARSIQTGSQVIGLPMPAIVKAVLEHNGDYQEPAAPGTPQVFLLPALPPRLSLKQFPPGDMTTKI